MEPAFFATGWQFVTRQLAISDEIWNLWEITRFANCMILYSVHRNTAMHYQIKIFQMVQMNMWIVSTAFYHKEYQWYGFLGGVAKVWYAMVWCSRVLWCMEWQGCGLQPFLLIAVSTGSGFFRTQQDTTWAQSSRHHNYSSQLNVYIVNIWLCQLHLINCKENPVIRYDSCGAEYVKRASFWWPSSLKTS